MKKKNGVYFILECLFIAVNLIDREWMICSVFFLLVVLVVCGRKSNNIHFIYFFIPQITVMNVSGFLKSPINMIIAMISLKFLLTKQNSDKHDGEKKVYFRISHKIFCCAFMIFFMEILHFYNYENIWTCLFNAMNVAFNFIISIYLLNCLDENDWSRNTEALIIGVIASFLVALIVSPGLMGQIFGSNYRLNAFANDPNYYSMYILIGITSLLRRIEKGKEKNTAKFVEILVLIVIGLLTSSKMFFLCAMIIFFIFGVSCINLRKRRRLKAMMEGIPIVFVITYIAWDKVLILINKILFRFRFQEGRNISDISSGRSNILNDYINLLKSDSGFLFWGKGMDYNVALLHENGMDMLVAHNTYLDVLLTWGIVGTIIFGIFLYINVKGKIRISGRTIFDGMGLVMMLIMMLALSCFNADMFWYLFPLNLIPMKKYAAT